MTIKKGTHAPLRLPHLILKPKVLKYEVTFTPSCVYYIRQDQSDINKLFGIGYFPNHSQNSVRFGWRYGVGNWVDIFAYSYINNERIYNLIGMVEIGKAHTFMITPGQSSHTLQVLGKGIYHTVPLYRQGAGYLLRPYFGGNQTAPHDIEINMREL
jgi:hypothetical protein